MLILRLRQIRAIISFLPRSELSGNETESCLPEAIELQFGAYQRPALEDETGIGCGRRGKREKEVKTFLWL